MKKVRFGIVGIGNQGTYYANLLKDNKVKDFVFIGELGLDGSLRSVRGILPMLISAREMGYKKFIIPIQNVRNLHLSDEIIDSVKKGKFHVYAVSTIDEGIEILTGVPAGKKDKNGKFPLGTINYLAQEKLKKFAKQSENK